MPTAERSPPNAGSDPVAHGRGGPLTRRGLGLTAAALAAACAAPRAPTTTAAVPPPPAAPVPFDTAVFDAADAVFAAAPPPGDGRGVVVIDPLVDGMTGDQTRATRQIQQRIAGLVRERHPRFELRPFSSRTMAQAPFVLIGTFTPVNGQGQPAGDREAFRFCLIMADLRSGRNVSKAVTRALFDGVDTTPTPFFQDSPAWTDDPTIKGYIASCQNTRVGDPISPVYVNALLASAMVSDAVEAYDAGRYEDALGFYADAQNTAGGDQVRVLNGLYLTSWKLGRRQDATEAFGRLVDHGLDNNRLALKLLFRPGSTAFSEAALAGSPYGMWLRQLALRAEKRSTCLGVVGNTSRTGAPLVNERLSLLRAEAVKDRLEAEAPALRGRLVAAGVGARENLVGTGRDDESDALDRRVEFKVLKDCSA